jgi:hypothetical protein
MDRGKKKTRLITAAGRVNSLVASVNCARVFACNLIISIVVATARLVVVFIRKSRIFARFVNCCTYSELMEPFFDAEGDYSNNDKI